MEERIFLGESNGWTDSVDFVMSFSGSLFASHDMLKAQSGLCRINPCSFCPMEVVSLVSAVFHYRLRIRDPLLAVQPSEL